ncbi:MAG TPA: Holliday junction branch migration protein RuvA [Myxococcota bacterium]|nr:Holliday junction branch migration protein RuvA [Myxococcota bacterium]HRY95761.1 Holliday junction branch migration protein RuvA [Myxococcota bacterium]
MIARLQGKLLRKAADSVVVDVHGVGYLVQVSRGTLEALPPAGEQVTLEIHTHVREDAIQLYGFRDADEQAAFEALISMNGVGPKAAIGLLSGIEPRELARAVCGEDLARLCLVPGVGKKRAERMVLELKERLLPLAQAPAGESGGAGGPVAGLEDLRSALQHLGFKPAEIEAVWASLRKRAAEGAGLDALVPEALRLLRSGA